jgi:hypothetical protein
MTPEIQQKLERFKPIRMVVKSQDGKIQGRVENSFSMSWDTTRANVFWSGPAYSMLGEHTLDGEHWAKQNINEFALNEFIIDPLAEDSPIEVDWEHWLNATDKFNKRNALFNVKLNGEWVLRAKTAERELSIVKPQLESAYKRLDEASDTEQKLKAILFPETIEEEE